MTYQVLARKWRPQKFTDLVGQDHVVKALVNALETGRLHHAYLFSGIRGVGKTTIARIFAKSLNCETGVTAEPCGVCSVCQDIMEGRFFDLIEVDAASNTGVDNTRELLENAQYKPTSGRYKVYLIDEVHMFSNSSFNALLKTLEEPPEHVKFLLATTESHKLPATVLSRCLQFNLKSMPQSLLSEYLATILKEESIDFEPEALAHVAKVADGSARDSLSLVEQVAALGEGTVKTTVVENLLGVLSPTRTLELVQTIASGDAEKSMETIEAMSEFSPDYRQLLADLLSILHHVAMVQMVPGKPATSSDWSADMLADLASALSPEDVQLFYQIAIQGQRDLPIAPRPREAFEMTVLRMLHFRPAASNPGASGNSSGGNEVVRPPVVDKGAATAANPSASKPVTAAETIAPASEASARAGVVQPGEDSQPKANVGSPGSAGSNAHDVSSSSAEVTAGVEVKADVAAKTPAPETVTSGTTMVNNAVVEHTEPQSSGSAQPVKRLTSAEWNQVVDQLPINGGTLQLARNCSLQSVEQQDGRQVIHLVTEQEQEELKIPRACQRLEEVLALHCAEPVNIEYLTSTHSMETAAQRDERLRQEAQRAAEESIAADPVVQNLLERVDGELDQTSIQPVPSHPG